MANQQSPAIESIGCLATARPDIGACVRSELTSLRECDLTSFEKERDVQLEKVRTQAYAGTVLRRTAAANGMTIREVFTALADVDPVTGDRRTKRSAERKRVERMVKDTRRALAEMYARGVLERRRLRAEASV